MNVHLICCKSHRFNKKLVTGFVRKADNLIFYGRAVSRSHALNLSAVKRRAVEIVFYDFVSFFTCVCEIAFNLIFADICIFKRERNYFIVTFDDGYRSNLTLAEPVLAEMHIPAAIFVVTGYVGTPHYMSWDDLRAARDGGVFTLYSHTHSHLSASEVPLAQFLADEKTAEESLSAQLGENAHRVLSYPNGAFTKESMSALYQDGYDLFVIQDKPAWHRENRHGKILLRVNVPGEGADMKEIANFHRARCGVNKLP